MGNLLTVIVGLIFLILPIYAWVTNFMGLGSAALTVLLGGLMWAFLLFGLGLLVLGIIELRN
ncbi:MAG: hypothetical protein ACI83O_000503 [Patescibacteria group bacterium]|jgi:hypothetical protein